MDALQIKVARNEKRLFLLSVLFNVITGLAFRLSGGNPLLVVGAIAVMIFGCVATWRFARSIGISKGWSAVNLALSPFICIVQLIVLLRMYSRRTGIGLTFFMGDRLPSQA